MSEFNFFEERIKIAQMNKSQPIPFSEIIIEAGMVKAFWWIIQEHEKEKQEHTISRGWEPNKVYHSLWA